MSALTYCRLLLGVAAFAMVGCQHEQSTESSSSVHAQTAGGNGEFGETPNKPGRYSDTGSSQGNTRGTPTDTGNNH
jgi:hypothetical protein